MEPKELRKYAYTEMSNYKSGLLIGYWRLKPILDMKVLVDTSINP